MNFLIDTDILIDISKGIEKALEYLESLKGELFISEITAMELIVGARNKEEIIEIEKFLINYNKINLNEKITEHAYELLKEHAQSRGLTIPDALIAATAKINNLKILTRNKKHYAPIKNLDLGEVRY